jgi:hypothetical protein
MATGRPSANASQTSKRYLTITEATGWLKRHYAMSVDVAALRRAVDRGEIVPYRLHDRGWCYFTPQRLARYARKQGFERQ